MGGMVAAFEVGNVAATLLILRATELLTPGRGVQSATVVALVLYTLYNVAATVASLPAGRVADRLGHRGPVRVLTAGVALFALAYAGFASSSASPVVLALPFVAAGLAIGCVETAQHSAVAALAPAGIRGSAFGLLATVQAVGNLAASRWLVCCGQWCRRQWRSCTSPSGCSFPWLSWWCSTPAAAPDPASWPSGSDHGTTCSGPRVSPSDVDRDRSGQRRPSMPLVPRVFVRRQGLEPRTRGLRARPRMCLLITGAAAGSAAVRLVRVDGGARFRSVRVRHRWFAAFRAHGEHTLAP